MVYSGAWGKLIHEKNQKQNSRDTVPLKWWRRPYLSFSVRFFCEPFLWFLWVHLSFEAAASLSSFICLFCPQRSAARVLDLIRVLPSLARVDGRGRAFYGSFQRHAISLHWQLLRVTVNSSSSYIAFVLKHTSSYESRLASRVSTLSRLSGSAPAPPPHTSFLSLPCYFYWRIGECLNFMTDTFPFRQYTVCVIIKSNDIHIYIYVFPKHF